MQKPTPPSILKLESQNFTGMFFAVVRRQQRGRNFNLGLCFDFWAFLGQISDFSAKKWPKKVQKIKVKA